jgi:4-aminobutyrate aminotransferase
MVQAALTRCQAERVMYACLSAGLSFKLTMGNIVTLVPPLTVTREQMDTAIDILLTAIGGVESGK